MRARHPTTPGRHADQSSSGSGAAGGRQPSDRVGHLDHDVHFRARREGRDQRGDRGERRLVAGQQEGRCVGIDHIATARTGQRDSRARRPLIDPTTRAARVRADDLDVELVGRRVVTQRRERADRRARAVVEEELVAVPVGSTSSPVAGEGAAERSPPAGPGRSPPARAHRGSPAPDRGFTRSVPRTSSTRKRGGSRRTGASDHRPSYGSRSQ